MPFIKFDPDTCTKTHWEVKRLRKRSTEKKYFSALLFPLLPSKMMKKIKIKKKVELVNVTMICESVWKEIFFSLHSVDAEGWEWKILNFTYIYSQTHTSNLINYKICVFLLSFRFPRFACASCILLLCWTEWWNFWFGRVERWVGGWCIFRVLMGAVM